MPEADSSGEKVVVYQLMTRLFGNTGTLNKKYGTIEENGVGKFSDITDPALKSLKELGVTHVWYTGVLEHATLTDYSPYGIPADDPDVVKGRAGSPYSIKDYYDVSPDLASDVKNRMAEFEALIERTHRHDLAVIIDFVPNHVARAYKSDAKPADVKDLGEEDDKSVAFKATNNFYYIQGQSFKPPREYNPLGATTVVTGENKAFEENPAKVTGNGQLSASPTMNDWFEAVKLNYGVNVWDNNKTHFDPVPDTWVKMRDILIFWAKKNVDGFRCDMAEMVPVEFWQWAVPQVKAVNSKIIFIAEIYNPAQYRAYANEGQFDFLYDKVQLYDTLRLLINRQSTTASIPAIQKSLEGINERMLHFLENHDEQRIASSHFAGDPWKAIPAMVVSATIDQGPIMIYFGQEVGEPALGDPGYQNLEKEGVTTKMDYWGVPEHQKWVNKGLYDGALLSDEQKALRQFYGDILNFAKSNPAIASGEYIDLTEANLAEGKFSDRFVAFARVAGEERLIIVAGFNEKVERIKVKLTPEVISKFQLASSTAYVGRDLLRSGTDVGLINFEFEVDVPPFSAYIFKIK